MLGSWEADVVSQLLQPKSWNQLTLYFVLLNYLQDSHSQVGSAYRFSYLHWAMIAPLDIDAIPSFESLDPVELSGPRLRMILIMHVPLDCHARPRSRSCVILHDHLITRKHAGAFTKYRSHVQEDSSLAKMK